jgi:hypothetical protein
MSDSKIYIPELWEDKPAINLDIYALKTDLNNFILKNTNIDMSDHTIENVKVGGANDGVNKSFVENRISSVTRQIPYMILITESVSISKSSRSVKIINKNIEDPMFNGLKPDNILLFVRAKIDYTPTDDTLLNYSAKVISLINNILNINIRIKTDYMMPAEVNVIVYLYIIIFNQKDTSSIVQNDQPSNGPLYEPVDSNHLSQKNSLDISGSYF